jgi:hypothetical protein
VSVLCSHRLPSLLSSICISPIFTVARPWCRYSALKYAPASDTYPCVSPGEAHTAVHESNKWPLARATARDTRQSLDMAHEAVSSDAAGVFAHYFAAHPDLDCSNYDVVEIDIYPRDLRLNPGASGARQLHEDYVGQPVVPVKFSGGNPGKRKQGAPVTMKRSDVRARIKDGNLLPAQTCAAKLLREQEQFRTTRSEVGAERKRSLRQPRQGSKKRVDDCSGFEPRTDHYDELDTVEDLFAQVMPPSDAARREKGAGAFVPTAAVVVGDLADLFAEFGAGTSPVHEGDAASTATVVAVATAQGQPVYQGQPVHRHTVSVRSVDFNWQADDLVSIFGY